ncbi:MAG: hypothetical protein M5R36_00990 [Deltaproteobacteria bacterium]|nr:hypothetical protein [Deltaproteobacteria bacterium]
MAIVCAITAKRSAGFADLVRRMDHDGIVPVLEPGHRARQTDDRIGDFSRQAARDQNHRAGDRQADREIDDADAEKDGADLAVVRRFLACRGQQRIGKRRERSQRQRAHRDGWKKRNGQKSHQEFRFETDPLAGHGAF